MVGKREVVEREGQGSTSVESRKAPMEIKVCGGTLKVSGLIKNTPCQFVVDTGADVTTLSYRVFHKLDSAAALKTVSTDGVIRGLDGQIIPVIGRVALEVTLGETVSKLDLWVVYIQEECIPGADFLKKEGCIIDYP